MPITPIDPAFAVTGPEFRVEPPAPETTEAPAGAGFGDVLGKSLSSLGTGQAGDPTAVVMAVERAQLAMQLASQIRTKAVEAAQDIFHTQV